MKKAVIFSFILAILHSILFYGKEVGASIILFIIPFIFYIFNILNEKEVIKNKKAFYLSIPIILLGMTYFIFNNTFFIFLNMIVIIALIAIMLIVALSDTTGIHNFISKIFFIIFSPIEKVNDAVKSIINIIFKKKEEKDEIEKSKNENIKKIILGIILSIPILIVILLLLTSADSIFAEKVDNITFNALFKLLEFDTIVELILRTGIIIGLTIYFVAFIHNLINDKRKTLEQNAKINSKLKIDRIIVNTIMTILNIIYLIFSYVQISALFMGYTSLSQDEYANYARQGFFQLMIVSLINLSIILTTSHIICKKEQEKSVYTKIMNILLAIFTLIILVSSFMRMHLYEQAFGYTFLRLMVYVILITEAILMIPTVMYILKPKMDLLKPYFIIIITMYVLVNYINIDGVIAKRNVDKFMTDQKAENIDFNYLSTLSVDSLSQIQRLVYINDNNNDDIIELKRRVRNHLYNERLNMKLEPMTWQSFNINRYNTEKALKKLDIKYEY